LHTLGIQGIDVRDCGDFTLKKKLCPDRKTGKKGKNCIFRERNAFFFNVRK